jgi:hypothetical protein
VAGECVKFSSPLVCGLVSFAVEMEFFMTPGGATTTPRGLGVDADAEQAQTKVLLPSE